MKFGMLLLFGVVLGFGAPAAAAGAMPLAGKSDRAYPSCVTNDAAVIKARGISGRDRFSFMSSGMTACIQRANRYLEGNEESYGRIGISARTIRMYCDCALNHAANNIEPADAIDILNGGAPQHFWEKVEFGASGCAKSIFKKRAGQSFR